MRPYLSLEWMKVTLEQKMNSLPVINLYNLWMDSGIFTGPCSNVFLQLEEVMVALVGCTYQLQFLRSVNWFQPAALLSVVEAQGSLPSWLIATDSAIGMTVPWRLHKLKQYHNGVHPCSVVPLWCNYCIAISIDAMYCDKWEGLQSLCATSWTSASSCLVTISGSISMVELETTLLNTPLALLSYLHDILSLGLMSPVAQTLFIITQSHIIHLQD